MSKNIEYTIIGRVKGTGNYNLIYVCGPRKDTAEEVLEDAKVDPRLLEKYDDFKTGEIESDAWWDNY